jgi:hypothetical protein
VASVALVGVLFPELAAYDGRAAAPVEPEPVEPAAV